MNMGILNWLFGKRKPVLNRSGNTLPEYKGPPAPPKRKLPPGIYDASSKCGAHYIDRKGHDVTLDVLNPLSPLYFGNDTPANNDHPPTNDTVFGGGDFGGGGASGSWDSGSSSSDSSSYDSGSSDSGSSYSSD